MADTKISDLAASGALDGSELVPGVKSGSNVQMTTGDIAALGGGGGGSFNGARRNGASLGGGITTTYQDPDFSSSDFDTDSWWDGDKWIVPSSANGKYVVCVAHLELSISTDVLVNMKVIKGGALVGLVKLIAQVGNPTINLVTQPIVVATGNSLRLQVSAGNNGDATISDGISSIYVVG